MRDLDENVVFKEVVNQLKQYYIRYYCPQFEPEFGNYEIKTHPPYYTRNWRINYLRRVRELELRDEAMKAARMKCHKSANAFSQCSVKNPFKEGVKCKPEYKFMRQCFNEEFEVEMDKRRRDVKRNNDWWWANIYDEDGEIGEQAKQPTSSYVEKIGDACEWVLDKLDGYLYRHDK